MYAAIAIPAIATSIYRFISEEISIFSYSVFITTNVIIKRFALAWLSPFLIIEANFPRYKRLQEENTALIYFMALF
jgi:hypothetical protein